MPCKKSGISSETLVGACSVFKHDNRLQKPAFCWAANSWTLQKLALSPLYIQNI